MLKTPEDTNRTPERYPRTVPLDKVLTDFPNVRQRITAVDKAREADKTAELAGSLREDGLLQRPLVRPHPAREAEGCYQLIFGNRRLAAAARLGWEAIQVEVQDGLEDEEARTFQMRENLEREALSPIEEGIGIRQMVTLDGKSRKHVAGELNMDPSEVTRRLNLLKLCLPVREYVHHGELSPANGDVLYKHLKDDEEAQVLFARRAVEEGLPKKLLEQYVKEHLQGGADEEGEVLEEERFHHLAATPTGVLEFKGGLLPGEGEERRASTEQREILMRFAAMAALMGWSDKPLRAELGLGLPAYPENVDDYYRLVFGLPIEEAEALLFRAARRFMEAGHRTHIIGRTLIAPYMDEVPSAPPPGLEKMEGSDG